MTRPENKRNEKVCLVVRAAQRVEEGVGCRVYARSEEEVRSDGGWGCWNGREDGVERALQASSKGSGAFLPRINHPWQLSMSLPTTFFAFPIIRLSSKSASKLKHKRPSSELEI